METQSYHDDRCSALADELAKAGIKFDTVFAKGAGGVGKSGIIHRGQIFAILRCSECGCAFERKGSFLRHQLFNSPNREMFCSRTCKAAGERGGVMPPPSGLPWFLAEAIKQESDLELGKAAEYLVCADLILRGYRAFPTDQGLPYDVVVDDDGRLIRIQVKSTTKWRSVPQRTRDTPTYLWHAKRAGKGNKRRYGPREFDIIALVALDIRCVAYMPIKDVVYQCIALRPPGTPVTNSAKRHKNIDEYPFDDAISDIRHRNGGDLSR